MLLQTLLFSSVAVAAGIHGLKNVDNLIVFGDSYTDYGRLGWFIDHDGEEPPTGTFIEPSNKTASGGYSWPYFVAKDLNATAFNYAVSGATCTNSLIERQLDLIGAPFPSVAEYEIPAFLADSMWTNQTTGTNTLYEDKEGKPTRLADNSVYALWIGTNDLGVDAFLTDSQRRTNATVARDFVDCVWEVYDALYGAGGRHFVLFNLAPLERSPLYASPKSGGAALSRYWKSKTDLNATAAEYRMRETTQSVNVAFEYGAPFHLLVKQRWPGATFTLLDVHALIADLMDDPSAHFDEPADATGYYYQCAGLSGSDCKGSDLPTSSFVWYDELHLSERSDKIIADEFVKLVQGTSKYGTYY